MVLENPQADQVFQGQVDDRLRMGNEPLDPIPGVVLPRLLRNVGKDGVEARIARCFGIQQDQGIHIGVNPIEERQLG